MWRNSQQKKKKKNDELVTYQRSNGLNILKQFFYVNSVEQDIQLLPYIIELFILPLRTTLFFCQTPLLDYKISDMFLVKMLRNLIISKPV